MKNFILSVPLLLLLASPGLSQNGPGLADFQFPVQVDVVILAQPFFVQEENVSNFGKEPDPYRNGTVIVIEADPELIRPRQALEPVLYAGTHIVERISVDVDAGRLVGLVPGTFDPDTMLVWFGTPNLPERLTREMVQKELDVALEADLKPVGRNNIRVQPDAVLTAETVSELYQKQLSAIVTEYVPQSSAFVEKWNSPLVGD